MMKKLFLIFTLLISTLFIDVRAETKTTIHLFYSKFCSHCHEEIEWLETLTSEYDFELKTYEITESKENDELLQKVRVKFGLNSSVVPLTVIGTKTYQGFNDTNKKLILDQIVNDNQDQDIVSMLVAGIDDGSIIGSDNSNEIFELPLLGQVSAKSVSLPIIAIVIGAIDGFNPCAMWVLIFLISMLMGMKDQKRKWLLGLTFLTSSALVYLLFMVAWLNIAINLVQLFLIRLLISVVAFVGAYINILSFYKAVKRKDSGCEVVDNKKRKKIIAKIKKFTQEKSLLLALLGVISLAISVNMIELACSAGLPLIFTQILALNDLSTVQYAFYIFIYIFFFLLDDILVFTIAMVSLELTGISTKYAKYSHLIGGIIMLLVAILMLFKPQWLMFNF